MAHGAGVTGRVRNDASGVTIDAFGEAERLDEFVAALQADLPPAASIAELTSAPIPPEWLDAFAIVDERGDRRPQRVDSARPGDLRSLRRRDRRPGQPPLPLRVHQLHRLRPALHHRDRRSLRPRRDDDGAVPDVPGVPPRIHGPVEPTLPRPAERLPGLRADARRCTRTSATSSPSTTRSRRPPRRSRGRPDRRGEGPRRLSPGLRRDDADAVARLRARKHRDEKPLAVMVADLAAADGDRAGGRRGAPAADVGRASDRRDAASARARGSPRTSRRATAMIGVFLPYTPLHHLLLADAGAPAGDDLGQPVRGADRVSERRRGGAAVGHRGPLPDARPRDRHARRRLGGVASSPGAAWCCGARAATCPGRSRVDRGFARPILACGAQLKNTVLPRVRRPRLARPAHRRPREPRDLRRLRRDDRAARAVPRHPAGGRSRTTCTPTTCRPPTRASGPSALKVAVQHHHAHVVSAMAEHQIDGPGDRPGLRRHRLRHGRHAVGRGAAGRRRGVATRASRRSARSRSSAAIARSASRGASRWRCVDRRVRRRRAAAGVVALRRGLERRGAAACASCCGASVNAPLARGVGRYFDAFGALFLQRRASAFEGQIALEWNQVADPTVQRSYHFDIRDARRALGDRPAPRGPRGRRRRARAARRRRRSRRAFHNTLAEATAAAVRARGGTLRRAAGRRRPAAVSRTRGSRRASAPRSRRSSTSACTRRCRPATAASRSDRRWIADAIAQRSKEVLMCLGVPGLVTEIDDLTAVVDFWGVRRRVRLDLVDEPVAVGDYVLNHVGFAIRRIPPEDVQTTLALYEELLKESQKGDGDLMTADVLGELARASRLRAEGQGVVSNAGVQPSIVSSSAIRSARAALNEALARAVAAIGRSPVSVMHVCGSHEQAIAQVRAARRLSARSQRDHGSRLSRVHHRHARDRRRRRAGAAGRPPRHLRRHAARPRHGRLAGRRPGRRRQGRRRLQRRAGGGAGASDGRGDRLLRHRLRDDRRRDRRGRCSPIRRRTSPCCRRTSTSRR